MPTYAQLSFTHTSLEQLVLTDTIPWWNFVRHLPNVLALSFRSVASNTRILLLNTSFATDAAEQASVQSGLIHPENSLFQLAVLLRVTTLVQYQRGVPVLQDLPCITHFELLEVEKMKDETLDAWSGRMTALMEDIRAHGKQIKNLVMTYHTDTLVDFLPTIQGVRDKLAGALHQKQIETSFYSVACRRYLDMP
ncbi:hypothetical protein BG006_009161 [Podila minutissima]|uniref:Uncharacterized protein n=1 Tax=Podila minutissima TaxID=64525 RepID=A0A9P5SF47_9FUNG|nr:hypothetical protein BG006_009161 [Podila minutissima]